MTSSELSHAAMEADITVVICAYTEERWGDILAAVDSARAQTLRPREIVLVVDHNPELLRRARASILGVTVLDNIDRRGLSGARNTALGAVTTRLVAFLDDDAIAAPDWLENLHAHLRSDNVLGVGGWVEPMWTCPRPRWFPDEFLWVLGCSYRGLPSATAVVRNPFGGCACLRTDIFNSIGGYRTEIGRIGTRPLGCEETELSIRASQQWPTRVWKFEPAARIEHKVTAARARWSYFRARCYAEGLSKAWLAWHLGSRDGLSAERSYVTRTLPLGVARGIWDGLRGDAGGFGRAAAIVFGLGCTATGYAVGTLAQARQTRTEHKRVAVGSPEVTP
jgi:glucosyl-dolichyl phosphate glucuronosyltransferase